MKRKITLFAIVIFISSRLFASNYYWVGGSGNWSDFSNHWATTSGGGTFYNQVPQSTDNVYFDALSFTASGQIVTVDQTIVQCADMTWTGLPTTTPTFYGAFSDTLRIYGSLALSYGMNFNFYGHINMEATTIGKTIMTAGVSLSNSILTFNGIGGWTLQDALTYVFSIYLNNGTLNTNNQTVNTLAFYSTTTSARALNMGSSIFNLANYNGNLWTINPIGMTLNAGTSIINGSLSGTGGNFMEED